MGTPCGAISRKMDVRYFIRVSKWADMFNYRQGKKTNTKSRQCGPGGIRNMSGQPGRFMRMDGKENDVLVSENQGSSDFRVNEMFHK